MLVPVTIWTDGAPGAALRSVFENGESFFVQRLWEGPCHEEALPPGGVLVWYAEEQPRLPDSFWEVLQQRFLQGLSLILLGDAVFSPLTGKFLPVQSGPALAGGPGDNERIWVINAQHPVTKGLAPYFDLPRKSMGWYPQMESAPMETLLCLSMLRSCELLRTGFLLEREAGRAVCLALGDASSPCYEHTQVQKLLLNAVDWFAGDK